MKRLQLPAGPEKPLWAGLLGAVSMLYLFVAPYQQNAPWTEWLWTCAAFATFLALYATGVIYWSRQRVVLRVCVAMAVLGISFTAYRPDGVLFFIFVAAFGPLAAGGRLTESAAIICGAAVLILGEWRLLWPPGPLPYVATVQAVLIGAAVTFVVREQIVLRRTLKTEERERIARDLHDILGHTLSVIILKSELAGRLLQHEPGRARAEIGDIERISRNALSEVREAISGYHAGDLRTELDRARSTLETAGIDVECHYEETGISIVQERVLALALREAVTNVIRHARAKRCRMRLERADGVCRLEVRDDGRGGASIEGFGMHGIRERIAAIGGTVAWNEDRGTIVVITVPASGAEGGTG